MNRLVSAGLSLLVVVVVFCWQGGLFIWPFLSENALSVAGYGFWLTAFGLLLTLTGFAITFEQLRRTKTVAEAAKSEAERIKLSLSSFDLAHGASRAEYALGITRRHINNKMWIDACDSFEDFRRGLNALKVNGAPLSDEQINRIEDASEYIQLLCEKIERGIVKENVNIDVAKTLKVLRSHGDLLSEIQVAIQRSII